MASCPQLLVPATVDRWRYWASSPQLAFGPIGTLSGIYMNLNYYVMTSEQSPSSFVVVKIFLQSHQHY